MSPALSLYLTLTAVGAPAARFFLNRRLAAEKEEPGRLPERLGHASLPRPPGRLVWLHAASVGEGLSLLPLITRLKSERVDVSVLVTSGTVTSARLLAERLPYGAFHQYVPVDIRPAVSRFLDHWRPDLAVWVESEIWPRLLRSVAARQIPALLLNARLSERSRARWQRLSGAAAQLFPLFDYVQAQDRDTAAALSRFGVPHDRLHVAGSFKGAAAPLPCDERELDRLRRDTQGRLVWVAASTHAGEEEIVLQAHARILRERPDALLLLAPRHPARGDEIAALIRHSELRHARRREGPPGDVAVYLADTLGEMGLWYRLADMTYVGGSWDGVGGHNPYEPVALGVPVLHGEDTSNFADIYLKLDAQGGARSIASPQELADAVLTLSDPLRAADVANRAAQVVGTRSESLDKALAAILRHLPAAT